MSKRITPEQPSKRIGAKERISIDGPPVENTAILAQLKAWLNSHKFSCMDSLGRLLRQPFGSFFTCLVIAVALSLPMGLTLLLKNLSELGGTWQHAAQISVFLDLNATPAEGQALQKRLLKHPSVVQVKWISQAQALKDFQAFSGLGQALQDLPENPLPSSLLVTPEQIDKAQLSRLADEIQALPKVQQVQLDILWVERLVAILQLGERFVFALTVLLIAALLLVVGNTIRLHIENRRIEIEVIKLVGGTDSYVRRPFLYMGVLYGFGGGVLAWLMLLWGFDWLNESVIQLAQLYGSEFRLAGVPVEDGFSLLFGALLLGYFAAWLAVAKHLRELLPS